MSDLSRRSSLLTTALIGALLPADVPEGRMVRAWLDSWSGVGHVVDAMHSDERRLKQAHVVAGLVGGVLPGRSHSAAEVVLPSPRRRTLARSALETLRQEEGP